MWLYMSFLQWICLMVKKNYVIKNESLDDYSFDSEVLCSSFYKIRSLHEIFHKIILPFASRSYGKYDVYLVKEQNVIHFTIEDSDCKFGVSFEIRNSLLVPICLALDVDDSDIADVVIKFVKAHQQRVIQMFQELEDIVEKL